MVCSIREGLEPLSEEYDVFLAPDGYHRVTLYWDGTFSREGKRRFLDYGSYEVIGVLTLDSQRFEIKSTLIVEAFYTRA